MKQLLVGVFSVVVFSASAELAVGHGGGFFSRAGGSLSGGFHHGGGVVSGATHHAGGVMSGATHRAGGVVSGEAHQRGRVVSHVYRHVIGGTHNTIRGLRHPRVRVPKIPHYQVAGIHANPSSAFQKISNQGNAWHIDPGVRGSRLNPGPAVNYAKQKAGQLSQKASHWNIDRTTGKVLTEGVDGLFFTPSKGNTTGGNNGNRSIPEPIPDPDPDPDPGAGSDNGSTPGGGSQGSGDFGAGSGTRIAQADAGQDTPTAPQPDASGGGSDNETDQANIPQQVSGAFLTRSPSTSVARGRDLHTTVNRSVKSLLRAGQVADHRRPVR